MNKKIFAKLLEHSKNDHLKITQPWIKDTFGVEVKRCDTLEQYSEAIDDACLHRYFSKYWYNDMKKWKHSGLQLINEVNNLRPRAVLDVTLLSSERPVCVSVDLLSAHQLAG